MTDINWVEILEQEDVEALWNALFQTISRHSAVRPLHFATDGAAVNSPFEINADLTQELFLDLFQKRRFDHYFNNGYTSSEIENEIAHIEVPNLVGGRLRKRYPESFRMARRVSSLLKTSARFRRFGALGQDASTRSATRAAEPLRTGEPDDEVNQLEAGLGPDDLECSAGQRGRRQANGKRPQRMVNQVYGLSEWPASKRLGDPGRFPELVKSVPTRRRDTRVVGRSGSSQVILSNPELEHLIVEVLTAIDSPADVRTIRQLTLSKIPLQDYNIASLDEELRTASEGSPIRRDPSDTRPTPEALLLDKEQREQIEHLAGQFLQSLRRAVNNNDRRYVRLLSTLWHCYYDPASPSQLEIARKLGVSDSLVSDNRRLIEHELKKLSLSVEDGPAFSESLQRLIPNPGRASVAGRPQY